MYCSFWEGCKQLKLFLFSPETAVHFYVDKYLKNPRQQLNETSEFPYCGDSILKGVTGYVRYRASHIILDYLQSLTPKLTLNTRKTYHFAQKKLLYKPYVIFQTD